MPHREMQSTTSVAPASSSVILTAQAYRLVQAGKGALNKFTHARLTIIRASIVTQPHQLYLQEKR